MVLDGSLVGTLDENDWSTRVGLAALSETPVYISPVEMIQSIDSLFLDFDLETFGLELSSITCWSAILEDSIYFEGSNGEAIHMQVMRDMTFTAIPNIDGFLSMQQSLKKPDDFDSGVPMSLLIFVQAESDKLILQARKQSIF